MERTQLCHIQNEVLGIEQGTHVPRVHILGIVFIRLMLESYFGGIPRNKTAVILFSLFQTHYARVKKTKRPEKTLMLQIRIQFTMPECPFKLACLVGSRSWMCIYHFCWLVCQYLICDIQVKVVDCSKEQNIILGGLELTGIFSITE